MAVQKVTDATEIKAGQWINKESIYNYGMCGHARQVVKVSKQRIYYTHPDGEDRGDFCLKKSVRFVSDTQKEAQTLYAMSAAKQKAHTAANGAVDAEYRGKLDGFIESRKGEGK